MNVRHYVIIMALALIGSSSVHARRRCPRRAMPRAVVVQPMGVMPGPAFGFGFYSQPWNPPYIRHGLGFYNPYAYPWFW
jgi:hypothetical protein